MKCSNTLIDAGITNPLAATVGCKASIIHSIGLHYVILRVKAELDQLAEGLSALGVVELMRQHPSLLLPWFVYTEAQPLTSVKVLANRALTYMFSTIQF